MTTNSMGFWNSKFGIEFVRNWVYRYIRSGILKKVLRKWTRFSCHKLIYTATPNNCLFQLKDDRKEKNQTNSSVCCVFTKQALILPGGNNTRTCIFSEFLLAKPKLTSNGNGNNNSSSLTMIHSGIITIFSWIFCCCLSGFV